MNPSSPTISRAHLAALWVIDHEIVNEDLVESNHPADHGGQTRYGITAATAARHGLRVQDIDKPKAVQIIVDEYWKFDFVQHFGLARKLLDISVNMGPTAAVKILQEALCTIYGAHFDIDGIAGRQTAQGTNGANPETLIAAVVYHQMDRYKQIVNNNHSQQVFIGGWLARALKV